MFVVAERLFVRPSTRCAARVKCGASSKHIVQSCVFDEKSSAPLRFAKKLQALELDIDCNNVHIRAKAVSRENADKIGHSAPVCGAK